MATQAKVIEILTRLSVFEAFAASNRIPEPRDGQPDRSLAKAIVDMEIYVDDPPIKQAAFKGVMNSELSTLMDEKLKTAMNLTKGSQREEH